MTILHIVFVATIAWLISSEQIFSRIRTRFPRGMWRDGVSCPFCVGCWVAIVTYPAWGDTYDIRSVFLGVVGVAGGAGLATTLYSILRQLHKYLLNIAAIAAYNHLNWSKHYTRQQEEAQPAPLPTDATHDERIGALFKR